MPRLTELLNINKLTLIVDLPQNDPVLAEAAIAAGADALQLHYDNDQEKLKKILKSTSIPAGIMINKPAQVEKKEVQALGKLGFDFINMKRDDLPEYYSNIKGMAKILGLGNRFTIDLVLGVGEHGADALDAAIIPTAEQGKDLVVGDLQNYISIIIAAGIPVIIPTERAIRPSEVAIISDTEAKGLMLTPVVLGTSAKHIEKNVKEFRVAVDDLG
jgi:hypothetical protein